MKTTVIYHSADYDGIFCREIAKRFLGTEDVEYIGWNFGDPKIILYEEAIPYREDTWFYTRPDGSMFGPCDSLIIMDLPCDAPFGLKAPVHYELQMMNTTWIDHHKSAIESHPSDIPGYRIDGVAACRLAWQWFSAKADPTFKRYGGALPTKDRFIGRFVREPLAVRLAGEYDIWDHRGDGDLEFQFGLDCQDQTSDFWKLLIENDKNCDLIISAGRCAMACYRKRDADIMLARSFIVEWEGLKFLALTTARCNSQTFAARDVVSTGHDALMAFYFNGREWSFSLYHAANNTGIDLSEIAKKHGGGGHRGACGFTCKTLPFTL